MNDTTKTFEVGGAIRLHSPCVCGGTFSEIIPLDMDERIEAGCGRLLLTVCSLGKNREWAYQDGEEPSSKPMAPAPCSTCGGKGCGRCGGTGKRAV